MAVALGVALGCSKSNASKVPFALWTMRPGDSFAAIQERARTVGNTSFKCVPGIRPYQHCAVRSTGMPLTGVAGTIQLIVDSAGTVVSVQFQRSEGYVPASVRDRVALEWKEEIRVLTAEWSAARSASVTTVRDAETRVDRWATADGSSSASVIYPAGDDTAQVIALVDETRLAQMRAVSPYADYVLQSWLWMPSARRDSALMKAVMVASGGASGAATFAAAPKVELADCELELADLVLPQDPQSYGARQSFGSQSARALEIAVPAVYPGWKIVFGQHLYLVSPTGSAEQVSVSIEHDYELYSASEHDDIFAFSLQRTRRFDTARRRLEDLTRDALCRASSDIVFVRLRNGALAEAVLVPLDEEAVSTQVSRMTFETSALERAILVVDYNGSYRTDAAIGSLAWRAYVHTDPPRVTERQLLAFQRMSRTQPADTSAGMILDARVAGDTLAVNILQEDPPSTQSVRVPIAPGGVLTAKAILDRIQ